MSGFALSLLSQVGITMLFALSYNLLYGQTGLLSFGHAVYFGLGGYAAMHAMRNLELPLELIPLAGAMAGLVFGCLFGVFSTRRGGVPFSMISLGVAEMVLTAAHMMRSVFGGEEGLSVDRTALPSLLGFGYTGQGGVLLLILAWLTLCTGLLWLLSKTLLGRLGLAVRDNPERVAFLGYSPYAIRFTQFTLAGLFAGVAGALSAINYESTTIEILSLSTSATVLLATTIGGSRLFVGPLLGAAVVTCIQLTLSKWTDQWQLYFGLLFIAVVSFVPQGLAGLALQWLPGKLKP